MQTIYLHDVSTGHLIIRQLPQEFTESDVQTLARDNDMRFSDISWGVVNSLNVEY